MLPGPAVPGCCLFFLHFLCYIHSVGCTLFILGSSVHPKLARALNRVLFCTKFTTDTDSRSASTAQRRSSVLAVLARPGRTRREIRENMLTLGIRSLKQMLSPSFDLSLSLSLDFTFVRKRKGEKRRKSVFAWPMGIKADSSAW